jgi:predicted RNase H-like HicB family nuclease
MRSLKNLHLKVPILVEPDGEGFYAHSPPFPGVHSYGLTRSEAVKHAMEGITGSALSMLKHNEPLPCSYVMVEREPVAGCKVFTRSVTVPLQAMA